MILISNQTINLFSNPNERSDLFNKVNCEAVDLVALARQEL